MDRAPHRDRGTGPRPRDRPAPAAGPTAARRVLALQASAGNHAVTRMAGRALLQRVKIKVPTTVQTALSLPTIIETDDLDDDQLDELDLRLAIASESVTTLAPGNEALFQQELQEVTTPLLQAMLDRQGMGEQQILTEQQVHAQSSSSPAAATTTQQGASSHSGVVNPHFKKMKRLRSNFGKDVHDQMHFAPTDQKPHHGVWGGRPGAAKEWVQLCVDSIYNGDQYLVASKPGDKGGRRYLINMGKVVGTLSGSKVSGAPEATHVEVLVDRKGNTISAFPSDPSIF